MKNSIREKQNVKSGRINNTYPDQNDGTGSSILKSSEIHYREIKKLLDNGQLIKIKNGVYRYIDSPGVSNQGFMDIAVSVPGGVICLLSALSYYELTTFNPSYISVAILRNTWKPRIEYPPVEFFYFSEGQYRAGIDEIDIEDVKVHIYCPEKTICDCFRYRNKLGLDVAREGLIEYLKRKDRDIEKLLHYAGVCRVKPLMQTWLHAVIQG